MFVRSWNVSEVTLQSSDCRHWSVSVGAVWLLWLETQQCKYILLTDLWPVLVSKLYNWEPQGHIFQLTKQYSQMTVRCTYTDQKNESIPTVTSHVAFLTPLEVTWRHLNWSQNTFRSFRENMIWSWNPFSKDVLQNVDLTLFFFFLPSTFLSHRSQSSLRKPSNPDREEESAEEEMKITWAQTLSQISCCKMLCHYSALPVLGFPKWCHSLV